MTKQKTSAPKAPPAAQRKARPAKAARTSATAVRRAATPAKPRGATARGTARTATPSAAGKTATAATPAARKPTSGKPAGTAVQAKSAGKTPTARPGSDLYTSIHALLHTMRVIERHEEALCSMHDELKRTGRLAAPRRRDLQRLVAELPAEDYQADLEAVQQALSA